MLNEFEVAVRQFQQALAKAGITGDVDVTLPREPMLKMHHEWLEAPVIRFGPLPVDFDRSVFNFWSPGGTWTIRHKRPEMGDYGKFVSAIGHHRAQAYEQLTPIPEGTPFVPKLCTCAAESNPHMHLNSPAKIAEPAAIPIPEENCTAIRDAALEEAAQHEDEHRPNCGSCIGCRAGNSIRALKSKPAPNARPKQEDYCPECEKPKTAHGMSCSQDVKPTPKPSCYHREGHSQPVVHDFGWALAQMRAGKKVRREAWVDGAIVDIKSKGFTGKMECLLATDWEVVP